MNETEKTARLARDLYRNTPVDGISNSKLKKKVTSSKTRKRYVAALRLAMDQQILTIDTGDCGEGNRVYRVHGSREMICYACGKPL